MSIFEYILCVVVTLIMFLAGIILHKIGTIRKWQLEEEHGG